MNRIVKTKAGDRFSGRSLLDYLVDRFTYHDRVEWRDLIRAGRIFVNDRCASEDLKLQAGDQIEYHVADLPEPPVDDNYRVIFEDECLLAVDKPGNLPCHPAGPFFHNTLWALLHREKPELIPRFVSRLDRETSGIVLIAKTGEMHRRCQAAHDAGQMRKFYVAMVEGRFPEFLHARGMICPDTGSAVRKKKRFVPLGECGKNQQTGRYCETILTRLKTSGTLSLSLVRARLVTGRQHQIRATLHSLGYPVVGDKLYGVDDTCFLRFIEDGLTETDRRKLRLSRQALHAVELHLPHPVTNRPILLTSPLPDFFGK